MSNKTVALRAVVGFNALTENDIIHVDPTDPYYAGLIDIGMLRYAYTEDDPQAQATILASDSDGETTTILGVAPAPARGRRRRSAESEVEKLASDGEADPE